MVHTSAEAIGDLIGNKVADKITEIPKERYIPLKERQNIIDELRLI